MGNRVREMPKAAQEALGEEQVCPVCKGSGTRALRIGFEECRACNGKGCLVIVVDHTSPWSERK